MSRDNSASLPISIVVSDSDHTPLQWTTFTKIIFVLKGTMNIRINDTDLKLNDGDVLLINPRELHSADCEGCIHAVYQLDLNDLPFLDGSRLSGFVINSVNYPHLTKYNRLRQILARLIYVQDQPLPDIAATSLTYDLVHECLTSFASHVSEKDHASANIYSKHTKKVLDFILEHFRDNLTLKSVADQMYLSVPYLSALFKKEVGVTFSSYYNDIRLNASVHDLLASDELIDDIARENGFGDSRTFLRLFKNKYGELPSAFRKQHRLVNNQDAPAFTGLFYPVIGKSQYLPLLALYLNIKETGSSADTEAETIKCNDIDYAASGEFLKSTFKNVCSISSAKALLFDEVRQTLKDIQQTIGYKYISFNGLLNIDPYLYSEDADGNPVFTFVLIDKIFDFLISIDLMPMVNFSYMPLLLCRDTPPNDGNYLFRSTPPKDFGRWALLITRLTQHLTERYGEDMVARWPFNVWRKPDVKIFSIGDREFLELYKVTYNAVKQVSSRYQFGTPALAYNSERSCRWDSEFIDFCLENGCRPDFLCMSFYNDNFGEDSRQRKYTLHKSYLNKDPDNYSHFLDKVEAFAAEKGLTDIPLHMLQWNLTVSHRNLINDTCFPACYIAKNLLENYDRTNSFCYWCSSDFSEELALPNDLFFGGPGMFTHNGLRKPSYYAFQFISRLGDELIGKGPGWFITRNKNKQKIIIMFYNYEHYSDSFADGNYYDLTPTDRYTPFIEQLRRRFSLKIENIDADHCFIREFFVNRNDGSCLDKWIEMGALTPQEDELTVLRSVGPGLYLHKEKINNGILHIESTLQPFEIRRVEIILRNKMDS